ncbi:unnamed protein product [Colias eurytheme]|nr:unnamed protein product [Colias eurytheme]
MYGKRRTETRSTQATTGHGNAGNQASHGNYTTGRRLQLRRQYRFGTWNVRGLLEPSKLPILERELERCNLTITGLSETHWKNSGHFDGEKHTIYFSGNENRHFSGVAIAIPKTWKNAVLGYNPINDRIISIKFNASPTPLNIIQVYAPTGQANDEVVEEFYKELELTIDKIPRRELLLVLGDFNAKVGNTAMDDGIRNIVGKYGLGTRNKRGERLIEFAANNSFTIMNTTFKQHPRRLYTWISPGDRCRNQIDYILIRSRWRSSITNTYTLPSADCHSDHQLLIGYLRVKLQKARQANTTKRIQINDPSALKTSIENKHSTWRTDNKNKDANSMWISAKNYILEALSESQQQKVTHKKQHWMTPQTWQLIEERRLLKSRGASSLELNARRSAIQSSCRRDRNRALAKICEELEQHSDKLQTKELHDKVRYLTRQFRPKTWAIEDSDGQMVTEINDIVNIWKQYCVSLFANHSTLTSTTYEINLIADREPDILRDEVRAGIRHLKNNKATGLDEIPIEVFKAMGETGVDLLYNICCKIWESGIWPGDWSKSIFKPLHKKGSTKKCNNYRLISLISHARQKSQKQDKEGSSIVKKMKIDQKDV